jgi:arylsulfatase A-like enzyme
MDTNLGRLLEALDETGQERDTIVVFTSDHGDMVGSHGLDLSGTPFEESVRVPLLVRYPRRIRGGQSNEVLVSSVDLLPTLLSLAGLPIPDNVQGQDLSDLLTGDGSDHAEAVYCQGQLGTPSEWRMVVRGLDKIVVDRNLRITQLHNLGQDPYELANLANDSGERRKRDEMRAILRDWMRRMSDQFLPSGLRLRS